MKTTIFTSERKTIGRICILLSLCTCLLTSVTCTAQNASDGLSDLPKHEIVFSAGIFPLIGVFYPSYNFNPFLIHSCNRNSEETTVGSFNLSYLFNFNKYHALGVNSTICFKRYSIYEDQQIPVNSLNTYWALQAQYCITFKRYNRCTLYCGISLGATFYFRDKYWKEQPPSFVFPEDQYISVYPNFHLSALGVKFGHKNNGSVELGVGTQGILKIGYCRKI